MPARSQLVGLIGLGIVVFFGGGVGAARASGSPFGGSMAPTTFLSSGANVGAGTRLDGGGTGLLLGGEVSVYHTRAPFRLFPMGFYLDGLRNRSLDTWRFSAGPELVIYPFVAGFDLGPVVESGHGPLRFGGRVRYFVPFVFLLPYAGVTVMTANRPAVFEAGVLVKLPLILHEGGD